VHSYLKKQKEGLQGILVICPSDHQQRNKYDSHHHESLCYDSDDDGMDAFGPADSKQRSRLGQLSRSVQTTVA